MHSITLLEQAAENISQATIEKDETTQASIKEAMHNDSEDFLENVDTNDNVNHPSHYTKGSIECIDAIESSMDSSDFAGYLKGNILKYLWRYKSKNFPVEDLEKARWYLNKLIDFEKSIRIETTENEKL